MVHALVDCLGEFVRKTLATWLRRRGGWVSLRISGAVGWGWGEWCGKHQSVSAGTEGGVGWNVGAVGKGFRTRGCSGTQAGAASSVPVLTRSQSLNSCPLAVPRRRLADRDQQVFQRQNQAPLIGRFQCCPKYFTSLLGAPLFSILKKQDLEGRASGPGPPSLRA